MATLVIVEGPAKGQKFALGQNRLVLIGRDHDATFQIVDEHMSRSHMQIKRLGDDDSHAAIDFGSANGVQINAKRIAGETRLSDGDLIRIGETSIVYSAKNDPDAKTLHELMRKHGEARHGTIIERPDAPTR